MIKFLELTKGMFALVDAEDFENLNKSNWNYSHGYARNGKRQYLHRIVMNAKRGDEVDHINRDKLDCRKSNLRIVSRSTNTLNHPVRKNNTSGIKGIWWDKINENWVAEIMINWKKISLGRSKDKDLAVLLRRAAEDYFCAQ